MITGLVGAFLLGSVDAAPGADTDERKLTAARQPRNQKIYISADKLIADREAKLTEFIGNVRATRGTTVITTDKLKIYYRDLENKNKRIAGAEIIKKIIASGSVKIRFGDILAQSQQAIYTQKNRTIVLSGADSKVWSSDKSIAGSKITLYMDDNRIQVSSGNENRVKAVFQTAEKI